VSRYFRDLYSGGDKLKFGRDTSYSEVSMIFLSYSGAGRAQSVKRQRYGLRGSNPDRSKIFFFSPEPSNRCGTPILLPNRYQGPFLGVKPSGREVSHSPPSSANFKYEWIYTSTPTRAFMTWVG